ncbi:MAG: THUMP-like domain-containing protein [Alphaproteobacteria bacterium]
MDFRQLLNPDIQKFIKDHEHENVKELALKKLPDQTWNAPLILDQIKVRQRAKTKSKNLYDTDCFIFPKSNVFEQTSSCACAAYKSSLTHGQSFIDLTAGGGVDAYYISKRFLSGSLIEHDAETAELLSHNFNHLKTNCTITIENTDAAQALGSISPVDFVFIDPARRENNKRGIYDLASCSPNIVELLPTLKSKTKRLMIKTSPILDIEQAVQILGHVNQVHVVQWNNECKEVLYLLDFTQEIDRDDLIITSVNLDNNGQAIQKFSYRLSDEKRSECAYTDPQKYIYEPGAAFLKAGGFKSIALFHDVGKLHPHSHLYTSDHIHPDFPGKRYEVMEIIPAKTKKLPVSKADLALRNFPGTVDNLRKKLKLSDGGEYRIFATTLKDDSKKLIICRK